MKKHLRIILTVAIMAIVLLFLTGCGNKLVATREISQQGTAFKEELEITFKKDKVNQVTRTYTFDSEEMAGSMAAFLDMFEESLGETDIEQKGKKVIMTFDAEAYAKSQNVEIENISKEELKEQLEEEGYKVN